MKRTVLIIMALALQLSVLTACGGQQNQMQNQAQNQTQNQTENQPQVQTSSQNAVDTSNFIGEEKAKEIALQRAELTADDVTFERVELDFDNGVWEYEVEFRQGRTEYDADINAEDGTILKWEVDLED